MSTDPPGLTPESPGFDRDLRASLEQAARLIERASDVVVLSHRAPDGDAVASTLAMARMLEMLNKRVLTFNCDPIPYNFQFLAGASRVAREVPDGYTFDLTIVLDCNNAKNVGDGLSESLWGEHVIVIDHHEPPWPDADVIVNDPSAAATGELLFALAPELGIDIDPQLAECLYCAIVCDTGSFRYGCTTPRALAISAELVDLGASPWRVASHVYENNPPERVELLAEVLRTLQLRADGRLAVLSVEHSLLQRLRADHALLDGIINHARGIRGVELAAQLTELNPGAFDVTLRSRNGFDASSIACRFGGSGSAHGAVYTVAGDVDAIIDQLEGEFQRELVPQATTAGPDRMPSAEGSTASSEAAH